MHALTDCTSITLVDCSIYSLYVELMCDLWIQTFLSFTNLQLVLIFHSKCPFLPCKLYVCQNNVNSISDFIHFNYVSPNLQDSKVGSQKNFKRTKYAWPPSYGISPVTLLCTQWFLYPSSTLDSRLLLYLFRHGIVICWLFIALSFRWGLMSAF